MVHLDERSPRRIEVATDKLDPKDVKPLMEVRETEDVCSSPVIDKDVPYTLREPSSLVSR